MIKILHIITGLEVGGAELMLKRLIEADPAYIPNTAVVSLTTLGLIGENLRAKGVLVHVLGLRSSFDLLVNFISLIKLLRFLKPSTVQTWMYHSDLLGGLAAKLAGPYPVVWNIRSTAIPQGVFSVTFWVIRLCAFFSYFIPDHIICCSNSARIAHVKLFYDSKKFSIIPNGYNFSEFVFQSNIRAEARLVLGFNIDTIVICVVGRFDPLKDFHNFVIASKYLAAKHNNVEFLMIGKGNDCSNAILRVWIEEAGLIDKFKLIGQQSNVAYYLSAADVFCLSSLSEAFPNVLVEAMAMGLPCVVTSAGDAADILGDPQFVVPVSDSFALSNALLRMCEIHPVDRKLLGERNSLKVREKYQIEKIRRKYQDIYDVVSI
jgi:glycosyltransferase involved in cell wall biosynthesis